MIVTKITCNPACMQPMWCVRRLLTSARLRSHTVTAFHLCVASCCTVSYLSFCYCIALQFTLLHASFPIALNFSPSAVDCNVLCCNCDALYCTTTVTAFPLCVALHCSLHCHTSSLLLHCIALHLSPCVILHCSLCCIFGVSYCQHR